MSTTNKTSQEVGVSERKATSRPMADRVEIWSIDRLIPSARNARMHSAGQIAEIASSIAAFGFIVPVLVDREGMIIARRGHVLAARKLKLEPSGHLDFRPRSKIAGTRPCWKHTGEVICTT
jgi:hypothetical protein